MTHPVDELQKCSFVCITDGHAESNPILVINKSASFFSKLEKDMSDYYFSALKNPSPIMLYITSKLRLPMLYS